MIELGLDPVGRPVWFADERGVVACQWDSTYAGTWPCAPTFTHASGR